MPKHCCVPECHSRGDRDRVSFFKFPTESNLRKKWIVNIRRDPGPEFNIGKYTFVCSKHFNADNMIVRSGDILTKKILKENSVPTIFSFKPMAPVPTSSKKSPKKRHAPTPEPPVPTSSRKSPKKRRAPTPEPEPDSIQVDPTDEHAYYSESGVEKQLRITIDELRGEVEKLKQQVQEEQTTCIFRFSCVRSDDEMQHLTGFKSLDKFLAFYSLIEPHTYNMTYWTGKETLTNESSSNPRRKSNRKSALDIVNEFFLTMIRLRRGWSQKDLAILFNISVSTVNSILITWINLLYFVLGTLPTWPSKQAVTSSMPEVFKKRYPNVRIIVDATEVYVERSSSSVRQSALYSNYKSHTTLKSIIGISPDEAVIFASELYEGSISDKELIAKSKLMNLLQPGDEVMADKGFNIEEELKSRGITLAVPPMKGPAAQMPTQDVQKTWEIASARIYVENAIGRIKFFKIFEGVVPLSLSGVEKTNGMKPGAVVVDEMFPEGAGPYMDLEEAGGSSGLLMDLAANEKSVHADFFNDFDDLFDDEDLQ